MITALSGGATLSSNAISSLRLNKTTVWLELGGSVGDLGTYIPIVLALTLVSNLDLSITLIFTGVYNIATVLLFGITMRVQPMKSIASVANFESPALTLPQIAGAGIDTAAVLLLLLDATGLMSFLYRSFRWSAAFSFVNASPFTTIKYVWRSKVVNRRTKL